MFYKIKSATPLPDYKLSVQFSDGTIKIYDITKLFKYPLFKPLKASQDLFNSVVVDKDGYGVIWNDDIDISCDELWENGVTVKKRECEELTKAPD